MTAIVHLPNQIIQQGMDDSLLFRHCSQLDKTSPITPIDITGCTFAIQLRDLTGAVVDELTTANGRIVIRNAANGEYDLIFSAATTIPMNWDFAAGNLEMIDSLGKKWTLWWAKFHLNHEFTL